MLGVWTNRIFEFLLQGFPISCGKLNRKTAAPLCTSSGWPRPVTVGNGVKAIHKRLVWTSCRYGGMSGGV